MCRNTLGGRAIFSFSVDLLGPTRKIHWYQAETGYDLTHFSIDWEAEAVICPRGHISSNWVPVQEANKSLIKVKFFISDCKAAPLGPSVLEQLGAA